MKKSYLLVFTLLGFAIIYGVSIWLEKLTPESVLTHLFDMNEPTRYVFVSDAEQPRIAVVDLLSEQQTTTIKTQTIAQILALNKLTGQLAYAQQGGKTIYLYDITSHEQTSFAVEFAVESLLFAPDNTDLFVIGVQELLQVDASDVTQRTLHSAFAEIIAVHYAPLSEVLWFIDAGAKQVVHLQLSDGRVDAYPLTKSWQHYSPSALSPDGEYLFFGAQDAQSGQWQAIIWQTANQQMLGEFDMSAPLIQPYIDVNSSHFIAIDEKGQGQHINIDALNSTTSFQTIANPSFAALGWIDSKLLVSGGQKIDLYRLNDMSVDESLSIAGEMLDLFVTADSRTALFTQRDSQALHALDMNKGTMTSIKLQDIKQPSQIIMGAGNSLCH